MAEPTTSNLIAGQGHLYVAPLGSTLPTLTAPVVWPSAWSAVGYTEAGIDVTYTPSIKSIFVDEEAGAVLDILATEKYEVASVLAETTLVNLNYAISASTITLTAGLNTLAGGSKPLVYYMIGVDAPSTAFHTQRVFICQKAIQISAIPIKVQRKDIVKYTVKWEARKIAGQDLFDIYDLGGTGS